MVRKIAFDAEKCTACRACTIACMDQRDTDLAAGEQPCLWITETEGAGGFSVAARRCRHCAGAPCAAACPTESLYRDEETGLVLYDGEKCVGCRRCEKACPFDAVVFRTGAKGRPVIAKCDGCAERQRAGLLPACVHACLTGAMHLE